MTILDQLIFRQENLHTSPYTMIPLNRAKYEELTTTNSRFAESVTRRMIVSGTGNLNISVKATLEDGGETLGEYQLLDIRFHNLQPSKQGTLQDVALRILHGSSSLNTSIKEERTRRDFPERMDSPTEFTYSVEINRDDLWRAATSAVICNDVTQES